jgi:hypothetical protein
MYQSFYLTLVAVGRQDLATCQLDLTHHCVLAQHMPRSLVATPGGLQFRANDPQDEVLGW